MPSNESLVPRNLPHGERIKVEAAMDAGGIPKNPVAQDQPSLGGAGVPSPPSSPAPLRGNSTDLGGFDVFENREPLGEAPPPTAADPVSLFQSRVAVTENPAVSYYLGRATEFAE
jgi:hypothetical protein